MHPTVDAAFPDHLEPPLTSVEDLDIRNTTAVQAPFSPPLSHPLLPVLNAARLGQWAHDLGTLLEHAPLPLSFSPDLDHAHERRRQTRASSRGHHGHFRRFP